MASSSDKEKLFWTKPTIEKPPFNQGTFPTLSSRDKSFCMTVRSGNGSCYQQEPYEFCHPHSSPENLQEMSREAFKLKVHAAKKQRHPEKPF
jgi:hypothetical protein